jgi:hypothetical protein
MDLDLSQLRPKEIDSRFNQLLYKARTKQFAWDEDEWRRQRTDAEISLEQLVSDNT